MKRAFTLIEMVVVLAVMAVLAHLAVRELAHLRDGKLRQAANRQLETIREAVFSYDTEGLAIGFLSDMGRLVCVTNGTLDELIAKPEGVSSYRVIKATEENLVGRPTTVAELKDEDVLVPTGWRGPYLRLPFGAEGLLDPWGNTITTRDSADLPRVWVTNGFAYAVSHYGVSGQSRERTTLSLLPDGGETSRLAVNISSESYGIPGGTTCAWYGPASGMITGDVVTVVSPSVVFEGLTPGVRMVRVKNGSFKVVKKVNVRPGDNLVEIRIP